MSSSQNSAPPHCLWDASPFLQLQERDLICTSVLLIPHIYCDYYMYSNIFNIWQSSLLACDFLRLYLNYLCISTVPTILRGLGQMFIKYLLNDWINEIVTFERSSHLKNHY